MLRMSSKQIVSAVTDTSRHFSLRATSFKKKVALKAANFLQLRTLPRLDQAPHANSILQRERSGLYRRWLQGVEGAVKRPRVGYVPTSRSRYTANVAIMFGRRRSRFPAAGRRRKSYESLLHAFVKKVAPARFRRISTTQFKRAAPKVVRDFRENLLTIVSPAGVTRRRALARAVSSPSYLSAPWRELLQSGGAGGQAAALLNSTNSGAKRRFLPLPSVTLATNQTQCELRAAAPYRQQMRVIRAGILRKALRRRRQERLFVDLRHSAIQRRLPKEQASRPWKLRRAVRR